MKKLLILLAVLTLVSGCAGLVSYEGGREYRAQAHITPYYSYWDHRSYGNYYGHRGYRRHYPSYDYHYNHHYRSHRYHH